MSKLDTLYWEKWWYEEKLENAEDRVKKYEREHDSLTRFKRSVTSAQTEFEGVSSGKSNALSKVLQVKKNSITAERYYTGMSIIFSGVGGKVVARVYTVMLRWISTKLSNYTEKIDDEEADIRWYRGKIRELENEIWAEQQKSSSC